MSLRRKLEPEARRAAILRAARCVFARQGYAQTVVEDIAAQAGIGKGTLYLYFESKEQIYLAALLEDSRRLNDLTRERMAAVETWHEKLQAYIDLRFEYLETQCDFLRIYLTEIRSMMVRGVRMDCAFFDAIRESERALAQVFAAAVARKEIRPLDPEIAACLVCDTVRGVMERRLMGWGRSADRDLLLDLLCRSFAACASVA